ncbi:hypothetical protein Goari_014972, partial [Gossypium aridum]|nr:hypothetical protein [Gossypium aridum]
MLTTRRGLPSQKGSWMLFSQMKLWLMSRSSSWATRSIYHMLRQKMSCVITLGSPISPQARVRSTWETQTFAPSRYSCVALFVKWVMEMVSSGFLSTLS